MRVCAHTHRNAYANHRDAWRSRSQGEGNSSGEIHTHTHTRLPATTTTQTHTHTHVTQHITQTPHTHTRVHTHARIHNTHTHTHTHTHTRARTRTHKHARESTHLVAELAGQAAVHLAMVLARDRLGGAHEASPALGLLEARADVAPHAHRVAVARGGEGGELGALGGGGEVGLQAVAGRQRLPQPQPVRRVGVRAVIRVPPRLGEGHAQRARVARLEHLARGWD